VADRETLGKQSSEYLVSVDTALRRAVLSAAAAGAVAMVSRRDALSDVILAPLPAA